MDCSTPGFPVYQQLLELAQTHVHPTISSSVILYPLLLPPSIFPSIRIFSNESVLCIRWPKYWSFSFSISPFNEYSGLISFRIDWLDLCKYLIMLVPQLCSTLCNPMDSSPPGSCCPRDFPGKNFEVGYHFLLQGNFSTQGLNPHLLHW